MMYNCEQCGCCCRSLKKSDIYISLDRGDGICKYLEGNRCSIYDNRPLLCRVDESYNRLFSELISKEEFYSINKEVCKKLQNMEDK